MQLVYFDIKTNTSKVFKIIECGCDNPNYGYIAKVYTSAEDAFLKYFSPIGIYDITNNSFENMSHSIYAIMSLGKRVSELITDCFANGDYMKAIILNAICDDYIMQMDKQICKSIEASCREKKLGCSQRYIPFENADPQLQSKIVSQLEAENYGITINDSFIISPAKSLGFIVGADKSMAASSIIHNCLKCRQLDCAWRE